MTVALERKNKMAGSSKKEKQVLPHEYGCEVLLEKTTIDKAKDTSFPNDAYLIWYKLEEETHIDLVRGSRVRIFDMYYDKYGTGVVQTDPVELTAIASIGSSSNIANPLFGKTIVKVSPSKTNLFALTNDGKLYAWGLNNNGLFGNGNTTPSTIPVLVAQTNFASKIIVDMYTINEDLIVLCSDGTIYSAGLNSTTTLTAKNNGSIQYTRVTKIFKGIPSSGNLIVQSKDGDLHATAPSGSYALGINDTRSFTQFYNLSKDTSFKRTSGGKQIVNVEGNATASGVSQSYAYYLAADGSLFSTG